MSTTSQDIEDLSQCLQGNICRCTGYRPILEAFQKFNETGKKMPFEVSLPKSGNGDVNSLILNKNYFAPNNLEEVRKLMELHMFVLLHQPVTKDQMEIPIFLIFVAIQKEVSPDYIFLFQIATTTKSGTSDLVFMSRSSHIQSFLIGVEYRNSLQALDIYLLFAILPG